HQLGIVVADQTADAQVEEASDLDMFDDSLNKLREESDGTHPEGMEQRICKYGHRHYEVCVITQFLEGFKMSAFLRPCERCQANFKTSVLQFYDEIVNRLAAGVTDVRIWQVWCDHQDGFHVFRRA